MEYSVLFSAQGQLFFFKIFFIQTTGGSAPPWPHPWWNRLNNWREMVDSVSRKEPLID